MVYQLSTLTAVGLDVKDDQKYRRNQNEQQAGYEAEIVGFHGYWKGFLKTYHQT